MLLSEYKLADNVKEVMPCPDVGIHCWRMSMLSFDTWAQKKRAYDSTGMQAYNIHWGCPHGGIYIVKG